MTQDELHRIFAAEGVYILEDSRLPGATNVVITLTDVRTVGGHAYGFLRAFSMSMGAELSPELESWRDNETTSVAGGPFSIQSLAQMKHELTACDQKHQTAADQNEFLRDLAGRCKPMVEAYRGWMRASGFDREEGKAEKILTDFQILEAAEKVDQVQQHNPQQP